jgi:hypothetical protein
MDSVAKSSGSITSNRWEVEMEDGQKKLFKEENLQMYVQMSDTSGNDSLEPPSLKSRSRSASSSSSDDEEDGRSSLR